MRRDISGWMVRLDDETVAEYVHSGSWRGQTLADVALPERESSRVLYYDGPDTITCGNVVRQALSLSSALRRRGLRPGDVISFQLPNWHEAAVVNLAAVLCGLVTNPVVPIYRDAEVGFILRDCRSRILFVPKMFRNYDYVAMSERLRPLLPDLQEVVVVRGEDPVATSFSDMIIDPQFEVPPVRLDPNAVKFIMYTSGTTGRPKGVLHTHNTIATELRAQQQYWDIGPTDIIFMPSPVTHITGFLLS
jgi:acyl-coenzyme A synthetase/AMP-(fatty) acid ligase